MHRFVDKGGGGKCNVIFTFKFLQQRRLGANGNHTETAFLGSVLLVYVLLYDCCAMARQLHLGSLDPNTPSGAQLHLQQQQHPAVAGFVFSHSSSRLQTPEEPALLQLLCARFVCVYVVRDAAVMLYVVAAWCCVLLLHDCVVLLADGTAVSHAPVSLISDAGVFSLACDQYSS